MTLKRSLKVFSAFILAFALLFVSMGLGSSKADASEWGMLSANYVTENSVSIHFDSGKAFGTVTLYKDGEAIYTHTSSLTTGLKFDYVVTSLKSNTTYNFEVIGSSGTVQIYDQDAYTTTSIPEEESTIGPELADSTSPDSIGTDSPSGDDTLSSTSPYTTDGYYYGTKRTSGWDKVGDDRFWLKNHLYTTKTHESSIIYSTGGSFQIKIKGIAGIDKISSRNVTVTLKEYDAPASQFINKVKSWTIPLQTYDQNLTITNAGSYVDGANKKAEFLVYFTYSRGLDNAEKYMYVHYFD